MAIKKERWEEAKALFQLSTPLAKIAKQTGIAKSGISMRAKKEGWNKEKLNKIIEQKVECVAKLNEVNQNIELLSSNAEKELVDKEVRHRIDIIDTLHNLQKGALNCHNLIVRDVLNELRNKAITGVEASRILANQGLDIDKISKMAGLNNNKPDTAIQINNQQSNDEDRFVINIIGR